VVFNRIPELLPIRRLHAAERFSPNAKAFFESLLARNKARLQALIAVARKLLHAIYRIFRSGLVYEGAKLFPGITLS
jgi:hypothetical protein